jgi:hypothetical protein
MDMQDINKESVEIVENAEHQDKVKILLDGLAKGECKGVKGATAYKIAEYAQKKGLI